MDKCPVFDIMAVNITFGDTIMIKELGSNTTKMHASERTKSELAKTMRELMNEKDYAKITISDIANRAGVNRKTFYYHFRSTDDLLAWMIENEALEAVADFDLDQEDDLRRRIREILGYLERNRELFHSVNHSVGRGAVHKFIYRNLYPLVSDFISRLDVDEITDTGFLAFISEFYTEAIAGVLQNWIEKPILRDQNEITEYVMRLISDAKQHLAS